MPEISYKSKDGYTYKIEVNPVSEMGYFTEGGYPEQKTFKGLEIKACTTGEEFLSSVIVSIKSYWQFPKLNNKGKMLFGVYEASGIEGLAEMMDLIGWLHQPLLDTSKDEEED